MNETQWIDFIARHASRRDPSVIVGIGDDAAVLRPPKGKLIVTTDSLMEGIHFDLAYSTPLEVGKKAIAVNLSDVAAMGAKTRFALVSLALPPKKAKAFLPGFYRGLKSVGRHHDLSIVGGNLCASTDSIFIDITLIGQCDKPVLRSGARPGDWVGLIGSVGEAAAGLAVLKKNGRAAVSRWPRLCSAQLTPWAHTEAAAALGKYAHACIDVSDGLASELNHLSRASKIDIVVDADRIALSSQLQKAAHILRADPLKWALCGGEDYALLFTAAPSAFRHLKKWGAKPIGIVVKGHRVCLEKGGELHTLAPAGFDHFEQP